jgi:hypothetical protein
MGSRWDIIAICRVKYYNSKANVVCTMLSYPSAVVFWVYGKKTTIILGMSGENNNLLNSQVYLYFEFMEKKTTIILGMSGENNNLLNSQVYKASQFYTKIKIVSRSTQFWYLKMEFSWFWVNSKFWQPQEGEMAWLDNLWEPQVTWCEWGG